MCSLQGAEHDGVLRPIAKHAEPLRWYVHQFLRRTGCRNPVRHRYYVGHLQVNRRSGFRICSLPAWRFSCFALITSHQSSLVLDSLPQTISLRTVNTGPYVRAVCMSSAYRSYASLQQKIVVLSRCNLWCKRPVYRSNHLWSWCWICSLQQTCKTTRRVCSSASNRRLILFTLQNFACLH